MPNHFPRGSKLSTCVPNQKMSSKDLDGNIDEVCALVIDQSNWAIKPGENEFINELNYDYNHVGP